MAKTNPLLDTWRISQLSQRLYDHMRTFGYQVVDLPIIQPADLFLVKAGDQVVNRLFTFDQHGKQLALRPEFTAAAAYQYVKTYTEGQSVVRWQFSGYIFEDDPGNVQADHQRYSIGAELIGMAGITADAEIIGMSSMGLIHLGINDWQIILGHIGLLRQMLAKFQLDSRIEHFILNHLYALKNPDLGKLFVLEQLKKLVSGDEVSVQSELPLGKPSLSAEADTQHMLNIMLDATYPGNTIGGRTRYDIARRLSQKRQRFLAREQISAALDFLETLSNISTLPKDAFSEIATLISFDDLASQNLLADWKRLVEMLVLYGISEEQIVIQPVLARLWDYYSGGVFELRSSDGAHFGGGGRYDGLTRLVGGEQTSPAVGFAFYVDEIVRQLPATDSQMIGLLTITCNDADAIGAMQWAQALRNAGLSVQILPSDRNVFELAVLQVINNTSIRYKDRSFTFDQLDTLVSELKQNV